MKKKFIPLEDVKKRAFAKNPKVKEAYDAISVKPVISFKPISSQTRSVS